MSTLHAGPEGTPCDTRRQNCAVVGHGVLCGMRSPRSRFINRSAQRAPRSRLGETVVGHRVLCGMRSLRSRFITARPRGRPGHGSLRPSLVTDCGAECCSLWSRLITAPFGDGSVETVVGHRLLCGMRSLWSRLIARMKIFITAPFGRGSLRRAGLIWRLACYAGDAWSPVCFLRHFSPFPHSHNLLPHPPRLFSSRSTKW